MLESSGRISREEEDLVQQSTKKVKTRNHVDLNRPSDEMDINHQNGDTPMITKVSYKESLLKPAGPSVKDDDLVANPIDEDEPNPKDKWYKTAENDDQVEKPFDPCPKISISKDEFDEWCKPWRAALMVKVLGK
ncbi:hypothetical protein AHAS_Ahas03G0129800 [Arachis hypogaea]